MSTLAEIEAAADTLSEKEKEESLRYLAMSLHKERTPPEPHIYSEEASKDMPAEDKADGKQGGRLTPAEFEAWWGKARGAGLPGISTDEIMAMTRGGE